VGGLGWLLGERVSIWLAALVTGIGAFAVVAWYEHEYAVVAARIRDRLQ